MALRFKAEKVKIPALRGGVCPFGLKEDMEIYLDVSLKRFEQVYPAAGSKNSCIEIMPEELRRITGAQWVDVCK